MITKFKRIYQFDDVVYLDEKEMAAVEVDSENFKFAKQFAELETKFFGAEDIPHLPEFGISVEPDGWICLWYLHNTGLLVPTVLMQLKKARHLEGWWDAEISELSHVTEKFSGSLVDDNRYRIKVTVGRDSETVVDIVITNPGVVCEPIFIKD